MDLHHLQAQPSAQERTTVDALLGPPEDGAAAGDGRVAASGLADADERRHLLLPALHAVQHGVGWISAGALGYVCERLLVPPAEAYGVADFYSLLATRERPPRVVHVCDDVVCRTSGA